jgi:hypothetical protein
MRVTPTMSIMLTPKLIATILDGCDEGLMRATLLDIITNSDINKDLLLSLLLQDYVPPTLHPRVIERDIVLTMTSINKWTDRVVYNYTRPRRLSVLVRAKDKDLVTWNNQKDYQVNHSCEDDTRYVDISHPTETVDENSDMRISSWLKLKKADPPKNGFTGSLKMVE